MLHIDCRWKHTGCSRGYGTFYYSPMLCSSIGADFGSKVPDVGYTPLCDSDTLITRIDAMHHHALFEVMALEGASWLWYW